FVCLVGVGGCLGVAGVWGGGVCGGAVVAGVDVGVLWWQVLSVVAGAVVRVLTFSSQKYPKKISSFSFKKS
ncbi:hypothetical protein, partial [Bartonella tribocorum]|uniref:hypothetical protein n=1 Tax=Bartonella tribocorum TaxID=85701 RepID=UPI001ABA3169